MQCTAQVAGHSKITVVWMGLYMKNYGCKNNCHFQLKKYPKTQNFAKSGHTSSPHKNWYFYPMYGTIEGDPLAQDVTSTSFFVKILFPSAKRRIKDRKRVLVNILKYCCRLFAVVLLAVFSTLKQFNFRITFWIDQFLLR